MLSLFCSQVNPGIRSVIGLEKCRHPTAAFNAVWIQAAGKKKRNVFFTAYDVLFLPA